MQILSTFLAGERRPSCEPINFPNSSLYNILAVSRGDASRPRPGTAGTLGANVLSYFTVTCWCAEFKSRRTSAKDDLVRRKVEEHPPKMTLARVGQQRQ
ncbi:hypothetical protein EVAR_75274_1 [Eumeta japonica]|uniref:Uncharacterized protein n=1 Tax=Eumeta variegata TaxID=151549 RepID=A0A4C1V875_EUMVA|nr:hypothetical protein EVAR_75274_1 [Eumeta japonica]